MASPAPGCAGRGSERSAEFGSVTHIRCPHARARLGGALLLDLQIDLQIDLQPRPGRCRGLRPARFDGAVAGGAVADSVFVISGSGQRWSSGGNSTDTGAIDDDDDVGFGARRRWWRRRVAQRGSATYRVIDSDRQILQH